MWEDVGADAGDNGEGSPNDKKPPIVLSTPSPCHQRKNTLKVIVSDGKDSRGSDDDAAPGSSPKETAYEILGPSLEGGPVCRASTAGRLEKQAGGRRGRRAKGKVGDCELASTLQGLRSDCEDDIWGV